MVVITSSPAKRQWPPIMQKGRQLQSKVLSKEAGCALTNGSILGFHSEDNGSHINLKIASIAGQAIFVIVFLKKLLSKPSKDLDWPWKLTFYQKAQLKESNAVANLEWGVQPIFQLYSCPKFSETWLLIGSFQAEVFLKLIFVNPRLQLYWTSSSVAFLGFDCILESSLVNT